MHHVLFEWILGRGLIGLKVLAIDPALRHKFGRARFLFVFYIGLPTQIQHLHCWYCQYQGRKTRSTVVKRLIGAAFAGRGPFLWLDHDAQIRVVPSE